VALEDLLPVFRYAEAPQDCRHRAGGGRGGRAQQPGLVAQLVGARCHAGQGVGRRHHQDDPVVHHRAADHRRIEGGRLRADRHVHGAGQQERFEVCRVAHAEFDVQVGGPLGEQFDQAGRRMLREQAGGRDP
jgi:hypothetical protein